LLTGGYGCKIAISLIEGFGGYGRITNT